MPNLNPWVKALISAAFAGGVVSLAGGITDPVAFNLFDAVALKVVRVEGRSAHQKGQTAEKLHGAPLSDRQRGGTRNARTVIMDACGLHGF